MNKEMYLTEHLVLPSEATLSQTSELATDLVEAMPDSMRHSIRRTCSCLISLFDTL